MEGCSKIVSINMDSNKIGTVNQTVNHYCTTPAKRSRVTNSTDINNCLAPVSSFIGREDELKNLSLFLEQHGVVVIVGMGGLGKTQLARKFVFDNTEKYTSCIYWMEAASVSGLNKSIRQLAGECDVSTENNGTERDTVIILKDVYKKIDKDTSLLIFDNVDKKYVIHNCLPKQLGFHNVKLHIIITSRQIDWTRDKIKVLTLDPLPESVALDLFKTIFSTTYNKTNTSHWKRLAEILGYLPLALQVASSYIFRRKRVNYNFTVSDYIDQLKKGSDEILEDPLEEYGNKSIYKSMMLSLDELKNGKDRKSKLAVKLLNIAAYLNPNWIYKYMLIKLIDKNDAECKLDEALVTVIDFSLMRLENNKYYTMHRIIQKSILYNQTENGTTDEYYSRALHCAVSNWDYYEYIFQHADERVSTVVKYFNEHKSKELLNYLVKCNGIKTLEKIFETQDRHIIMDIINEQNVLHLAVKSESVRMVEMLCSYGSNVNLTDNFGDTAIHVACAVGKLDIVQCLLNNGADPALTDIDGRTALHTAVWYGYSELVSDLLKHNKNLVNIPDDLDKTPLLIAAMRTCPENTSFMLQKHKELVHATNVDGCTPLHVLSDSFDQQDEDQMIALARILIDNGASILKSDRRGWTILHYAAWNVYPKYASFVLQANRKLVDATDVEGRTPLLVMGDRISQIDEDQMIEVARILIDNGASMLKSDSRGWTVLHYAARRAYPQYVSFILQKNRELVHATDKNEQTPFHVLGAGLYKINEYRMITVARILIDNGASMLKSDSTGWTILHNAARYAYQEYASFILQQHRELVHATDVEGRTPLHVICNSIKYTAHGNVRRIASVLMEHGASAKSKDNHGRTPLDTVRPVIKEILKQLLDQNHGDHTDSNAKHESNKPD